mmetsp:Transcript_30910/g.44400  ORF Transcript_30910/g.44400 Transcript_30910/m.44400 type:complete len:226 (+) Transcript_30910:22-699(+)
MNHQLNEAVRRAESRAAVLQSLKVSYMTSTSSRKVVQSGSVSENVLQSSTTASISLKNQNSSSFESKDFKLKKEKDSSSEIFTPKLNKAIEDSSKFNQNLSGYGNINATLRASSIIANTISPSDVEKYKDWLSDGIHNKSVLLDSKSDTADFNTSQRTMINQKRTRNSRMLSNKKRKALLGSPLDESLSADTVGLLHASWTSYLTPLAQDSALSDAQLQARFVCH